MANNLQSPGVSVTVIDQSNYAPTSVGTIPLIVLATSQDKTNPSGVTAAGTTKANAGKVYNVGDQRSLSNLFGMPKFPFDASGNRIYGSELAEYGLYAAYNVLDTISSTYIVRADIDLAQLEAKEVRPFTDAAGGTLWLNTSITQWGIFAWNADVTVQSFARQNPEFLFSAPALSITDPSAPENAVPAPSYGSVGGYAIVGTNSNNPVYFKNYLNAWVKVGSAAWQRSVPTVSASYATVTSIVTGQSITVNGIVVTATGSTDIDLKTAINASAIPGVTADIVSNVLKIFVTSDATSTYDETTNPVAIADGKLTISDTWGTGGTILTELGINDGIYACPIVQFSKHSTVPQWKTSSTLPRPSGSIWVKTTNYNYGANLAAYIRNGVTKFWTPVAAPAYANDYEAIASLDPTRGGLGISRGALYSQYNVDGDGTVNYKIFTRNTTGPTIVEGTVASPALTASNSFTIRVSQLNSTSLSATYTITVPASPLNTAAGIAAAISTANIPHLTAGVTASGNLTLTHANGGVIVLTNVVGTPLTTMGITTDLVNVRQFANTTSIMASNWVVPFNPAIIEQPYQPLAVPSDGTLWNYAGVMEADIMINVNNTWQGYRTVANDARGFNLTNTDPNGVIFSYSTPTVNSIGDALNYGDLWISTANLDEYPIISRWERSAASGTDQWVLLNTADATTENGVVFGDARWDTDGTSDVFLDDLTPITSLLVSNYLDADAPDANLYPDGSLLFNTRRSSNNVKKYIRNYFTLENFPQTSLPAVKSTWQSNSGKRYNNVPFFGRLAVRNVVVSAMQAAIDTNTELREEGKNFNLLLCPGYPELLNNLKQLNDDRTNTGFIIGEVPMGLSTDLTTVQNYLTDYQGTGLNGEDSLVTSDAYTGVFYPGAASTSALDGVGNIIVPMSAKMLRTMVLSDQNSEMWFAPAGNTRGVVDCSAIGYVDRLNNNAFVQTGTPQSLRDMLYTNRVNPVTFFPQVGYINYGNHTRQASATALDRINVARLVTYIRTNLKRIILPLVFEPNDKITRDTAKALCDSLFNDLVARRAVYDYLVVCDNTNNTSSTIDQNILNIDIAIEPVKAVEFIYIPVTIKSTGAIAAGNLASSLPLS